MYKWCSAHSYLCRFFFLNYLYATVEYERSALEIGSCHRKQQKTNFLGDLCLLYFWFLCDFYLLNSACFFRGVCFFGFFDCLCAYSGATRLLWMSSTNVWRHKRNDVFASIEGAFSFFLSLLMEDGTKKNKKQKTFFSLAYLVRCVTRRAAKVNSHEVGTVHLKRRVRRYARGHSLPLKKQNKTVGMNCQSCVSLFYTVCQTAGSMKDCIAK